MSAHFKPARRRGDPVGYRSHEATTILELAREKRAAECEVWELDGGGNWYDLAPDEQTQRLAGWKRTERIQKVAILSTERYILRHYAADVRDLNLMWDLWSHGRETPETKAIRMDLLHKLDAVRKVVEAEMRARIEARIAKAEAAVAA